MCQALFQAVRVQQSTEHSPGPQSSRPTRRHSGQTRDGDWRGLKGSRTGTDRVRSSGGSCEGRPRKGQLSKGTGQEAATTEDVGQALGPKPTGQQRVPGAASGPGHRERGRERERSET